MARIGTRQITILDELRKSLNERQGRAIAPVFLRAKKALWGCDFSVVSGGNTSITPGAAIGQVVDQRACCLGAGGLWGKY